MTPDTQELLMCQITLQQQITDLQETADKLEKRISDNERKAKEENSWIDRPPMTYPDARLDDLIEIMYTNSHVSKRAKVDDYPWQNDRIAKWRHVK